MIYFGILVILLILFSYFLLSSSKQDIYDDLKRYFNSRKNFNGETEIILKNRKVIVKYETEYVPGKIAEYVVAYIDFSDFSKEILEFCRLNIDWVIRNGKSYAVIYSRWGYQGQQFKESVESKIDELIQCAVRQEDERDKSDNHH